mmetsp:Transcript_4282/g.11101  ORF Transcript_4282/g.11101 Transcript_4282/m.11101 type:complete len:233 (+) Transcript_4282:330-1028(+)
MTTSKDDSFAARSTPSGTPALSERKTTNGLVIARAPDCSTSAYTLDVHSTMLSVVSSSSARPAALARRPPPGSVNDTSPVGESSLMSSRSDAASRSAYSLTLLRLKRRAPEPATESAINAGKTSSCTYSMRRPYTRRTEVASSSSGSYGSVDVSFVAYRSAASTSELIDAESAVRAASPSGTGVVVVTVCSTSSAVFCALGATSDETASVWARVSSSCCWLVSVVGAPCCRS